MKLALALYLIALGLIRGGEKFMSKPIPEACNTMIIYIVGENGASFECGPDRESATRWLG